MLKWVVLAILVVNTVGSGWVAWGRFSRWSGFDSTTTGEVVGVRESSGRSAIDAISATFSVGGQVYTAYGTSDEDGSLNAHRYKVGSPITVYYSADNPAAASLAPTAGFLSWAFVTVLCLVLTGYVFFVLVKR